MQVQEQQQESQRKRRVLFDNVDLSIKKARSEAQPNERVIQGRELIACIQVLRKNSPCCSVCYQRGPYSLLSLECDDVEHIICMGCVIQLLQVKPMTTPSAEDSQDIDKVESCLVSITCPVCRSCNNASLPQPASVSSLFQSKMLRYATSANDMMNNLHILQKKLHQIIKDVGEGVLEIDPDIQEDLDQIESYMDEGLPYFECPNIQCVHTFLEPVPLSHLKTCNIKVGCSRCGKTAAHGLDSESIYNHLLDCPSFFCHQNGCSTGCTITLRTRRLHRRFHKMQEEFELLSNRVLGSHLSTSPEALQSLTHNMQGFMLSLQSLQHSGAINEAEESHLQRLEQIREREAAERTYWDQ